MDSSNYDDFVYDLITTTLTTDQVESIEPQVIQPQDFSYLFDTNPSEEKESILNLINYDETESKNFAQKILNVLNIKNESNKLKGLIITLAVIIVACGILVNTIFNTIIVIRKRYTAYNIIKLTMCTAYLVYLVFYCFKISVYANDIQKYHIYDTLETWAYGASLCQFINGLLPTCKFISRFSMLLLSLKHLVVIYQIKSQMATAIYYSTATTIGHTKSDNLSTSSSSTSFKWKLMRLLKPPYLLVPIGVLVIMSILLSLPIYNSYKLTLVANSTLHICDCLYDYPTDNPKYALVLFNYLIFGLIMPCVLIVICLVVIVVVNVSNNLVYDDYCTDERKLYLVIIIVFVIHITTTLPNDIYKYVLLMSDDYVNFDYGIMQSIVDQLTQPIAQTKFYYFLQLLYVSEFLLVPCVFLLFYVYNTLSRNSCHKTHYNVTDISLSSGAGSRENIRDIIAKRTAGLGTRQTTSGVYIQQASIKKTSTSDDLNDYVIDQTNRATNGSSGMPSTNASLSGKTDSLSQIFTVDRHLRELTELPELSNIED